MSLGEEPFCWLQVFERTPVTWWATTLLVTSFWTRSCRKQSDLKNKQIFFVHDNDQQHSSKFTTAFFGEFGWFIFLHPAYLADLAPSDFWLFPRAFTLRELNILLIDMEYVSITDGDFVEK